MRYWLGIDVGTSSIAAAICRTEAGQHAQLEVVPLGARSAVVRSVVYLAPDGEVVVGDAAERRATADPEREVREFTRRIGEESPIVIGGVWHSAADLLAQVVRWVIDRVAQREGGPAQGITLTYPASWDADKIQIMADALGVAGLAEVRFCTGPQAAAVSYSSRVRIDVGSTLAVYDLGGGHFETAVVRKTGEGTFAILGVPEEIKRLGGAAFDDAVLGHVLAAVPALSEPDAEATARLRRSFALCQRECTQAKEALSAEVEVMIPVLAPQVQSQICLSRAEFEDLIRPQVEHTVEALRCTLRSADVAPADVDVVLLVGGSSRVPLVAQLVSAALGRPVVVDDDPQAVIALGAAASGSPSGIAQPLDIDTAATTVEWVAAPAEVTSLADAGTPDPAPAELPPWLTTTPLDVDPPEVQRHPISSVRSIRFAAAGLLGLVIAGGAVLVPIFMSDHHAPTPAPAAGIPASGIPAPPVPLPAVPLPAIPEPQISEAQIPDAQNPEIIGAAVPGPNAEAATRPPAPGTAPGGTVRSRTAAPHAGASQAKPPPATTPSPPLHVPDWVSNARN
jgi:molecular chaperone DnaK